MVVYKDGPFELWDLRTLSLLRTMPKKFPFVTALVSFKLLFTAVSHKLVKQSEAWVSGQCDGF